MTNETTEPVRIDLRDLTAEKLAECKPNAGGKLCLYQDPCIIGTLIAPELRRYLDRCGDPSIDELAADGVVDLPDSQLDDSDALQRAFDRGDWSEVERIAAPYIAAPTPQVQP